MVFQIVALLLIHAVGNVVGDLWTQYGCYKLSDVKSLFDSGTSYQYQSSSYCQNQCDDGVVGLVNGNYCYCGGDTVPSSDLEADMDNCDTPCYGYGSQVCGGSGYMLIFTDTADQILTEADSSSSSSSSSTSTSSSSSKTSTSASTTSSRSSSSSTTTSSASPSSSSSGATSTSNASSGSSEGLYTVVSTVTSSPSETTITKSSSHSTSKTSSESESTSSSTSLSSGSLAANSKNNSSKSKSLSGGAIAGIVIGALAGVLLILGLVFLFIWYRRRQNDEEEDDMFTLGGAGAPAVKGSGSGGMNRSGSNSMQQIYDINNNPFLSKSGSKRVNTGNIPNAAVQGGIMTNGIRRESNHQHNQLNSFSSHDHDEEYFLFDRPKVDITGEANKKSSEYGRRRLSNGSLPDMATRNPGSLKVVNN